MGVLLTAALIVAGTAVGVGAEHRYPTSAITLARRLLRVILYVAVPIVIFFNLAKASISLDNAVGILLALATMVLIGTFAWFVASRVLGLSRPHLTQHVDGLHSEIRILFLALDNSDKRRNGWLSPLANMGEHVHRETSHRITGIIQNSGECGYGRRRTRSEVD